MKKIPEAGEIFIIVSQIEMYTQSRAICLYPGDIVVALGAVNSGNNEIFYCSGKGVETLPDDETFFCHEAKPLKIESFS